MEKKQNRSVQAPAKGSGTDAKKNQDAANGKYWPRGGRKREPTGSSFPNKNEPNRKPAPQRNKSLDKRPKPRGGYYAGANTGKENTGVKEHDAELGSVFVPGSKKQSLNHLLNFHYTPRGDNWNSGVAANKQHRWLSTYKHKYNKEQFLQANCQFVVNCEGDYKLYLNNPDSLVDWDLVEQIHVQVTEFPSCPICLYPPSAAKMTRCGHVYCWSCILHYLALSDKTYRKCPICYEAVHKNDLKSVVSIPHPAFNIGDHITLRLMQRAQGSLTAIPVEEAKVNRNVLLNLSENKVNTVYSKLLLANFSEVMSIIDRERKELTIQISDDENYPEKCFIEEAINQLNDREKIVLRKISAKNDEISDELKNSLDRNRLESVSSEDFNLEIADNNTKHYYFYQASDGQHIYLHAVNIRMLEHTYGSLENCPRTLRGRIVEKEGGSMTEEIRHRFRCLQHLPLTCQFEVAEIHLRPPVVSKETLDHFQDQLETRKKSRQKRARDEKRREKRIQEEENRRFGTLPEVNMHIESLNQFPEFCGGDEAGGFTNLEMTPSERSSSPSMMGSIPNEDQHSGPSFAKMLATGKSKPPSWPGLPTTSSTPRSQTAPIINNARAQSDSEPEPEGYIPVPTYNQSFSDAITYALEQASIRETRVDGETSGGKKKKRNKQKILFATSMGYSGK